MSTNDVCAPNKNNGTCFPLDEVKNIIKKYITHTVRITVKNQYLLPMMPVI